MFAVNKIIIALKHIKFCNFRTTVFQSMNCPESKAIFAETEIETVFKYSIWCTFPTAFVNWWYVSPSVADRLTVVILDCDIANGYVDRFNEYGHSIVITLVLRSVWSVCTLSLTKNLQGYFYFDHILPQKKQ